MFVYRQSSGLYIQPLLSFIARDGFTCKLLSSLIAALSFMVVCTPLQAEPKVIDRIVAVVGNVAISSRELAITVERVKENMARQDQELPDIQVLVPSVLEQLIVVKLQLQEAERLGIAIDEITLDQMLTRIAADNGKTLAEMKAEIERQQGNYSEMRESVRQEFIISQLRQRVVDNINVSESEIETALVALNVQTLFRFSYLSGRAAGSGSRASKINPMVSRFA